MLLEVMRECRNYFTRSVEKGVFTISQGVIDVKNSYCEGQYIRIIGSVLNDGVYMMNGEPGHLEGVKDECFDGVVCGLAVPEDFLRIVEEIQAFADAVKDDRGYGRIISESFGGYTYHATTGDGGRPLGWKDVFAKRLHPYRKAFDEKFL